jgi:predicted Zn-dependent peptidase
MTVEITRLANGLTIASDTMATVETVSIGAWVGVGTRLERPEVNGISHFLEHMVFKGTERRSARDIAEEIEAVGGHLNAYTSRENTAFYAKVLADDLPLAIDVLADILQHSTFAEDEVKREQAVVLQEIGQAADTPDDIIFDHFQETAYPDQALGRPVLGRSDIVSSLDRGLLNDYITGHYGPQRMVISAAGKLDHARLVEQVAGAFGDLTHRAEGHSEPAAYTGGEHRGGRDLEQVHLILGFQGVGFLDPDHYTISVLSTLFGGGMSSRLFQEVRENRGLVYSIYSFVSAYMDGGLFAIYAGTGESEVSELLPLVCQELSRLGEDVSDAEVARAQVQLKAGLLMGRESSGARCEHLAQQILIHGRPIGIEEMITKIEAVDAPQVRTFAQHLTAGPPTFTALGPIGRIEPFERLSARLN